MELLTQVRKKWMEINITMRNKSGEWDGSLEMKDILEWSDAVLPAKE